MRISPINMTKKILPIAAATAVGAGALISGSTPASAKPGWYYKAQREYAEKERRQYMSDDNNVQVVIHGTRTSNTPQVEVEEAEATQPKWPQPKSNINYNISAEQIKEAKKMGEAMQDCLHGYTTQGDWDEFYGYVKKVNPQNVMYVLAGYVNETKGLIVDSEGFCEQLGSECANGQLINKTIRKMMLDVQTYVNDNLSKLDKQEQQFAIKMLNKLEDAYSWGYQYNYKIDTIIEALIQHFDINSKIKQAKSAEKPVIKTDIANETKEENAKIDTPKEAKNKDASWGLELGLGGMLGGILGFFGGILGSLLVSKHTGKSQKQQYRHF